MKAARIFSTALGLVGSAALLSCLSPLRGADALRVTVLDFALAHSPGGFDAAVADFSRAVQARMLTSNDYAWVERQELDRITRETDLGGVNRVDPATAVRLGHLLRADLLLRGEIAQRAGGNAELTLEVVDLRRAEVLASRVVPIAMNARQRLHPTAAEVTAAGDSALAALAAARDRLGQATALRVLAPLYFKNSSKSDRLTFLEERLNAALVKAAVPATGFRTLSFPRPGEAGEEASLVLSGLTDTDPDAWQHVADAYVWGTFAESGADGTVFEEVPVTITLEVWNGTAEPKEIKWTGAVKDLPTGLDQLAAKVLDAAKVATSGAGANRVERERVAASLGKRADEVARQIKGAGLASLQSTAGRQLYSYRLRLLEVACFFDPMNRDLQEARLQAAWDHGNPFNPGATLRGQWRRAADFQAQGRRFQRLANGELDGTWPARQSEGLHGFLEVLDQASWRSAGYEVSPEEVHRQLRAVVGEWCRVVVETEQVVGRESTVPSWYAGLQEEWFKQAGFLLSINDPIIVRDALEQIWPVLEKPVGRLLHAPVDQQAAAAAWTTLLFSTYQTFADDARPNAMLEAAWRGSAGVTAGPAPDGGPEVSRSPPRPRVSEPWAPWKEPSAPQPRPLPAAAADPAVPRLAAAVREISPRSIRPYLRTAGPETELFKSRSRTTIDGLAWRDGKLWIAESNQPLPAPLGAANPQGDHYLWCYDPVLRSADLITPLLGGHPAIRTLLPADGALWLGPEAEGVWRFDPVNHGVRRFKGEDGLQSLHVLDAAPGRSGLLFLNGVIPGYFISTYAEKSGQWSGLQVPVPDEVAKWAKPGIIDHPHLAVSGDWVCFSGRWQGYYHFPTKRWVGLRASPDGLVSADETGFWFANWFMQGAISFVDPNVLGEPRILKVPGRPTAMVHHGPWLWILLDEGDNGRSRLGLIDKRTFTFVGQVILPADHMNHLAVTDNRLWVGGSKSAGASGHWEDGLALMEVTLQEPRPARSETGDKSPADFPVLRAVDAGDRSIVEQVLASKPDLNAAAPSGWTALMRAAVAGRSDLVARLLEAGANPNLISREGDSALQQAVVGGDPECVRLLLKHGAQVNLHAQAEVWGLAPVRGFLQVAADGGPTEPAQPASLKATVTTEGAVALNWEDQANNETHYEVLFRNGDGGGMLLARLPPNSTQWIDRTQHTEAELDYSVVAANDFGPGHEYLRAPKARVTRPVLAANVTRIPYDFIPGATEDLPAAVLAQSALAAAAATGRTDLVDLLLAGGADPNLADGAGCTPLIDAVRHRQSAVARRLLTGGAKPEVIAATGETAASIVYRWHEDEALLQELLAATPAADRVFEASELIFEAAGRGRIEDIQKLQAVGGDLGEHLVIGRLPLTNALEKDQVETARWLLRQQAPRLKSHWSAGRLRENVAEVIEAAIASDRTEFFSELLDTGLPVNQRTGGSPLVVRAAAKKSLAVLRLLRARGADLTVRDDAGETVADFLTPAERDRLLGGTVPAAATWRPPTMTIQMQAGPPQFVFEPKPEKIPLNAALVAACRSGDLAAATAAVAAGAELDCYGPEGRTPLMYAFMAKAYDLVRWLVIEGASVNHPSQKGSAPLAFAMETGQPDLVDLMLQSGADLNACGDGGFTPVCYAAATSDLPALEKLLNAGADPNQCMHPRGGWQESPLARALWSGKAESVDLLLARGANPRAQAYDYINANSVGEGIRKEAQPTLLMFAAVGKNLTLVKQMIALGQDPGLQLGDGYDALTWAAGAGAKDVVVFLLPLSRHKGRALESAVEKNQTEIAELLRQAGYQQ